MIHLDECIRRYSNNLFCCNDFTADIIVEGNILAFIAHPSIVIHDDKWKVFCDEYNLYGNFELGSLVHSEIGFSPCNLFVFSKTSVDKVHFGIFWERNQSEDIESVEVGKIRVPVEYSALFCQYCNDIEDLLNEGAIKNPNQSKYDLNSIDIKDVDYSNIHPRYYSKRGVELRRKFANSDILLLKDIADIIVPTGIPDNRLRKGYYFYYPEIGWVEEGTYRLLSTDGLKYPLSVKELDFSLPTSHRAKPGMLLIPKISMEIDPYLIRDSFSEIIYISPFLYIVEGKKVNNAFIYLYLTSEIGRAIIDLYNKTGQFRIMSKEDIENLPIILPLCSFDDYAIQASILTNNKKKYYELPV